jgi:hypothetical protein
MNNNKKANEIAKKMMSDMMVTLAKATGKEGSRDQNICLTLAYSCKLMDLCHFDLERIMDDEDFRESLPDEAFDTLQATLGAACKCIESILCKEETAND